jgi:hypothetical protein
VFETVMGRVMKGARSLKEGLELVVLDVVLERREEIS